MNIITPNILIQNLSQDCQYNERDKNQNNKDFAPWQDRYALPIIKSKYHNPETSSQKMDIKKNLDISSRTLRISPYQNHNIKNKSRKKVDEKRRSISYNTIDLSELPYHSLSRIIDKCCNGRYKKMFNFNKKHLRDQSDQQKCIQQQRIPMRSNQKNDKDEELKKKIKRKKVTKQIYQGLITKQYFFPRKLSLQQKKRESPIINVRLKILKEPKLDHTNVVKPSIHTYTSFFLKHKFIKTFDEVSIQLQESKQEKGLPQILQLSRSLFSKVIRENKMN